MINIIEDGDYAGFVPIPSLGALGTAHYVLVCNAAVQKIFATDHFFFLLKNRC